VKGIDEMVIANKKAAAQKSIAVLDENNLKKEREISEKKKKVISSFASISPIIDVTNNDFFEMRNGEYMEIIQVSSKDIYSLNPNDRYSDMNNIANFLLVQTSDIKLIPLNVPLNLEIQKRYLYKKIKQNKNPAYQTFIEKRYAEMNRLENNRTNREYFLFIYEEDERKLLEKKQYIKNLLQRSNPVIELSLEKKYNILFQLNNPNTKPLGENV
jgi:hypothetical protein